jgi:hypothetical protein
MIKQRLPGFLFAERSWERNEREVISDRRCGMALSQPPEKRVSPRK